VLFVAVNGLSTPVPGLEMPTRPEISGSDSRGQPLRLSAHRGKVWSLISGQPGGPCLKQMPEEKALVSGCAPTGRLAWRQAAKEPHQAQRLPRQGAAPWPNWPDDSGRIRDPVADRGIPFGTSRRKGVVRAKGVPGTEFQRQQLEETILEVLKEVDDTRRRQRSSERPALAVVIERAP